MSEWYTNYSLPLNINDNNLNEYINLLKSVIQINEDDILQNKVEQIENDYLIKLNMSNISNREKITLCGSTKFKELFDEYNRKFTLEGKIVLMPGCYAHFDNIKITEQEKINLDSLHKDKILESDSIFIINKDGYIGESTRSEIEFAIKNNKPILYLQEVV